MAEEQDNTQGNTLPEVTVSRYRNEHIYEDQRDFVEDCQDLIESLNNFDGTQESQAMVDEEILDMYSWAVERKMNTSAERLSKISNNLFDRTEAYTEAIEETGQLPSKKEKRELKRGVRKDKKGIKKIARKVKSLSRQSEKTMKKANENATVFSQDNIEFMILPDSERNKMLDVIKREYKGAKKFVNEYEATHPEAKKRYDSRFDEQIIETPSRDYTENVSTIMSSGHSKIHDRIAAFRERRDTESVARAEIVESMRADNLRLQQRREALAELTGSRPIAPQYNFADRHYSCEDVVARNQEQETPRTPVKQSFIGRFKDVFSAQHA